MTAAELSGLLHGRRVGKGRYVALCPVHKDRHPSLSIWVGKRHPVMMKCMSQSCATKDILEVLGLKWADVMTERISDPVAFRKAMAAQKAEAEKRKREKRREGKAIDWARRCDLRVNECGRQLAGDPESAGLAKTFHRALDQARNAQAAIRHLFHPSFPAGEIP